MFRDYRFVQGYDNNYIISNIGEVWSIKFGKVRLMKLNSDTKGYLQIDLSENGKRKSIKVHVLVGIAFIGLRTGTLTYDHIDRNRLNNRAENIRLATQSEQSQNQNVRKNNKLGFKNICEEVYRGYKYYKIKITRNGKSVRKRFNKDKYSLEYVVSERDKMLCLRS